ncbi:hypothetical protein NAPIS_ORF01302 [Vairimorpha apis BRL 01]|uniref:Uncharacterized protein n=1 Tax=Vairimorpha apis BRL 01 TaxID=1037528 RepID=T0MJK4_9MICR|nr:hypothetical protein NAPIS_ORF01302 [Vairimorpha apis BRL 01]
MKSFLLSLSVIFLLFGKLYGKEAKLKSSQWWWPTRDTPVDPIAPSPADPLATKPADPLSSYDSLSSPYGIRNGFSSGYSRTLRRSSIGI